MFRNKSTGWQDGVSAPPSPSVSPHIWVWILFLCGKCCGETNSSGNPTLLLLRRSTWAVLLSASLGVGVRGSSGLYHPAPSQHSVPSSDRTFKFHLHLCLVLQTLCVGPYGSMGVHFSPPRWASSPPSALWNEPLTHQVIPGGYSRPQVPMEGTHHLLPPHSQWILPPTFGHESNQSVSAYGQKNHQMSNYKYSPFESIHQIWLNMHPHHHVSPARHRAFRDAKPATQRKNRIPDNEESFKDSGTVRRWWHSWSCYCNVQRRDARNDFSKTLKDVPPGFVLFYQHKSMNNRFYGWSECIKKNWSQETKE
jgi:hypothetical protein